MPIKINETNSIFTAIWLHCIQFAQHGPYCAHNKLLIENKLNLRLISIELIFGNVQIHFKLIQSFDSFAVC